jgi:hypothetical protein
MTKQYFWGAQAVSLQRSAACRTHLFADEGTDTNMFAASCREVQTGNLCSPLFDSHRYSAIIDPESVRG